MVNHFLVFAPWLPFLRRRTAVVVMRTIALVPRCSRHLVGAYISPPRVRRAVHLHLSSRSSSRSKFLLFGFSLESIGSLLASAAKSLFAKLFNRFDFTFVLFAFCVLVLFSV